VYFISEYFSLKRDIFLQKKDFAMALKLTTTRPQMKLKASKAQIATAASK